MRFSIFTSAALLFASAAWAEPTTLSTEVATATEVVTREDQANNEVRSAVSGVPDVPEIIHTRAEADHDALEARQKKAKWEKVKVYDETGQRGRGGRIRDADWPDCKELAQIALYQAGCTEGVIIYRFHSDNSQDPEEHMTVQPLAGDYASHGNLHVHTDGSWTQGPGGRNGRGDGRV